jgi:hypothetical protein
MKTYLPILRICRPLDGKPHVYDKPDICAALRKARELWPQDQFEATNRGDAWFHLRTRVAGQWRLVASDVFEAGREVGR